MSSKAYFEWKAHDGKVYDVQFGSGDEEKVYSLGEDKMFYLWATSTKSALLLREIHFENYQLPPQLSWQEQPVGFLAHVTHPAAGKNKLFGFCFEYKYILISSVEGKVVYKVSTVFFVQAISQFVHSFKQF